MGMRLRSQREPSKRCVCVCGGGGRAQHLTQYLVNCACTFMAASVETGQSPIAC